MLLNRRSIGFTAAVVGFFAVSIVGAIEGLAPYTCSKRALIGAVISYSVASAATRAIDAILTRAMIASQIDKEGVGDDRN
ncbi:MAG: hypothetical protein JW993_03080 [Sedimentisphaerales bacterium]|nr:hypothetical protein [Sedimentisphaerales bacterium]